MDLLLEFNRLNFQEEPAPLSDTDSLDIAAPGFGVGGVGKDVRDSGQCTSKLVPV